MDALSDKKIVDSWQKNADPWARAIREKSIPGRRRITDRAMVETLASLPITRALDVGCGEGWLTRELSACGIAVEGIDAVPALVEKAREQGVGDYRIMEYEALSVKTVGGGFDLAVCNFSLLGQDSVEVVFSALPAILKPGGHLVVQTLHPTFSCDGHPYVDAWRQGSWEGFGDDFTDPAPWFFRTLETWFALYHRNGFSLTQLKEPFDQQTGKPASLIMVGVLRS
ncbi:class I SAM-dependent methyltransferase [Aestuariirhabdus sp. Z084]|uniref:class I SAM-dependent DNA methyltransferase n=1 Tax=Aestuariirhabdus haliotis TaxID=2918751 RepID=UPI00201B3F98|nr:class I SAM-dependent methyltransferase [Aestuariirhabdus haliotis]MCL6415015.1 class I SAM-dependent methyltransferase [Aestuariirhabdus haliotis]MCL6418947.1 class I SAM-dependent methyltransferase [Aestuariirhabdus haliotis]